MKDVKLELGLLFSALSVPDCVCEFQFAPPRRWRFDYAWPALWIALEFEGGVWTKGRHTRGKGYSNDCEKYSTAALLGWKVLRITSDMIGDGRAATLLERAFHD